MCTSSFGVLCSLTCYSFPEECGEGDKVGSRSPTPRVETQTRRPEVADVFSCVYRRGELSNPDVETLLSALLSAQDGEDREGLKTINVPRVEKTGSGEGGRVHK